MGAKERAEAEERQRQRQRQMEAKERAEAEERQRQRAAMEAKERAEAEERLHQSLRLWWRSERERMPEREEMAKKAADEGDYKRADQGFIRLPDNMRPYDIALRYYHQIYEQSEGERSERAWTHAVAFEKKYRGSIEWSLRQEHDRLLAQRRTRIPPPNAHPILQRGLRLYGTAHENFAEAQKWRGVSKFGEVPGGQPNSNNALHYFNAALSIDPTHEFAISHRAICLWNLGRQHEAVGVLSVGLAKNQFPNHADTVRGWLKEMYSKM